MEDFALIIDSQIVVPGSVTNGTIKLGGEISLLQCMKLVNELFFVPRL